MRINKKWKDTLGYSEEEIADISIWDIIHTLKDIEDAVRNGAKLTRQLFGYARKGIYNARPLNLNSIVEETSEAGRLYYAWISGSEAYDKMKEINAEVKVLLSSGYSIEGQASEILNRGCNGFIQKPFSMKNLSEKINKILEI